MTAPTRLGIRRDKVELRWRHSRSSLLPSKPLCAWRQDDRLARSSGLDSSPRFALPFCVGIFAPWFAVAQATSAPQPAGATTATGSAPASPGGAKEQPQMKATIKRAPDGSIIAYEISTEGVPGAERATIEYTPNSRTIDYGEGQGGTVKENYYNVGVRKDVATSDGDHRTFLWERLRPKTEHHVGGLWQGWAAQLECTMTADSQRPLKSRCPGRQANLFNLALLMKSIPARKHRRAARLDRNLCLHGRNRTTSEF